MQMYTLFLYHLFLANCTTEIYAKADGKCACAFYLDRGLTWRQAADECYTHGARLPEIYSIEENKSIFNLKASYLIINIFLKNYMLYYVLIMVTYTMGDFHLL
jgi:hypothetical protein